MPTNGHPAGVVRFFTKRHSRPFAEYKKVKSYEAIHGLEQKLIDGQIACTVIGRFLCESTRVLSVFFGAVVRVPLGVREREIRGGT